MLNEVQGDLADLFAEAAETGRKLSPDPSLIPLPESATADAFRIAMRQGKPAVLTAPPQVRAGDFVASWQAMARVVQRHHPEAANAIAQVGAALAQLGDAAAPLVAAVLRHDTGAVWDEAVNHHLDPKWVYLVGELAARPFLRAYAQRVSRHMDLRDWQQRYCPVCGRRPNVGIIVGDNRKRLHCPGCGVDWPTKRYACGLCGQDDRGALHFLTVDEWPGWRIETCNQCQGYLKVIDQREPGMWWPDQDLFVEDGRTLALDAIAQQQGYRKPELSGGMDDQQPV